MHYIRNSILYVTLHYDITSPYIIELYITLESSVLHITLLYDITSHYLIELCTTLEILYYMLHHIMTLHWEVVCYEIALNF